MERVERHLRAQAQACERFGSPLYAALLAGAADDVARGGVVADLLAPHRDDSAGSALGLRLAGALHRLVLLRQAPELALHYPSVGGTAPPDAVWPAAERACRRHRDELRTLLRRTVQTNEVGRSAVLVGVLQHAVAATGRPVRLLEVGASAGLNLRCDAFAYEVDDDVLGDAGSPVRLRQPWAPGRRPPRAALTVVQRLGCDPAPLDPTSVEGRLTLTSYVWADQQERLERLRGALHVAARVPATVVAQGAATFLRDVLAAPTQGVVTVVWHSVVRQYIDPDERADVDALLQDAAERSTPDAPLVHAFLEPERDRDDLVFRVHARLGVADPVHLADAQAHGAPVHWTGLGL
jgi:hypothetical protein